MEQPPKGHSEAVVGDPTGGTTRSRRASLGRSAAPNERWGHSDAHQAIVAHFGNYLMGRIQTYAAGPADLTYLTRWQCVVYFDLIAGKSNAFSVRVSNHASIRHNKAISSQLATGR